MAANTENIEIEDLIKDDNKSGDKKRSDTTTKITTTGATKITTTGETTTTTGDDEPKITTITTTTGDTTIIITGDVQEGDVPEDATTNGAAGGSNQNDTAKCCSAGGKWISIILLTILSCITFQYIPQPKLKKKSEEKPSAGGDCCRATHCCLMLSASLVCISIHVIPLAFFIYEWTECPYDYNTSICFTVEPFTKDNMLAKIVLRDTDTLDTGVKKGLMQEFIDFSKIALLFSTTANAVSHVLFIFSLWALYFMRWDDINECINSAWNSFKNCCCGVVVNANNNKTTAYTSHVGKANDSNSNNNDSNVNYVMPLDPFDDYCDEEDNFDSSCVEKIYNKKKKPKKEKKVMAERICKKSRWSAETDEASAKTGGAPEETGGAPEETGEASEGDTCNFFGERDDRTSTPLQGARSWHFIIWFIIGLSLITITAAVLLSLLEHNKSNSAYGYEITALVLYFVSLYRNLVSCFIFSKLMYGIQRRCEELELFVYHINENYRTIKTNDDTHNYLNNKKLPTDDEKILALKYLIQRDKDFVETAKATLSWLQLWFLFHWAFHIISTFMVIKLFIEALTLHVKANIKHIQMGINFDQAEMGFLFMYSLVQCFFLLHPCLKAASVTRTRQRVIRKISDKHKFSNLPDDIIPQFAESMKRQKFSFRLRILCASITFNLNIAYLSIAFGFVGIVVSLITSVRSTDLLTDN